MKEYTWNFKTSSDVSASDLGDQQRFRELYTHCLRAFNEMVNEKAEWDGTTLIRLEADSSTICALQSLEQFELCTIVHTLTNCDKVGTLGRFEVWRNELANYNYILITNNGKAAKINICWL